MNPKPCTCCGKSAPEVKFDTVRGKQSSWCVPCRRDGNALRMRVARLQRREALDAARTRVERAAEELTAALAALKEMRS